LVQNCFHQLPFTILSWHRTAPAGGVQLPAAAARWRVRTPTAIAAASADGRPKISAMRAIGPPITQTPMPMCTGDPMIAIAPPRHTRAIVRAPLPPATVRNDAPTITAIAAQTPDEPPKTLDMPSDDSTRGVHARLRTRPIHFVPRTEMTIGAVRQGAIARVLRRDRKPTTTRAGPNHETTGRRIRIRRQVHAVRPGALIAHPWALIAVANPQLCTSS
jgi:hypothetical protein